MRLLLLAAALCGTISLVATSNGLNDRFGRPLGTDFSNVYAADTYVLDGEASAPFDPELQYRREAFAALWLVPLVAPTVALTTLVPLAVPVMLLSLALLLQRAMTETRTQSASGVLRPAA